MKDKIGASDRIGFVLNGVPLDLTPPPPPVYCKEKLKPGGCQLHNLHCRYPVCDRPPKQ